MSDNLSVSEAVLARKSIRAFLDTPISGDLIREVLSKATTERFKALMLAKVAAGETETPEYDVYPTGLKEPYRSRGFKVGEDSVQAS